MSTEEDGVDEAGRTAQTPLIMAPRGPEADPEREATDTIVDNGVTSSSRAGSGSSRSAAAQRSSGAQGNSSGEAAATAQEATEAAPATVPLPADTVAKAKADATRPEKADAADKTADASAAAARDTEPAANGDRPSFGPSVTTPVTPAKPATRGSAAAAPATNPRPAQPPAPVPAPPNPGSSPSSGAATRSASAYSGSSYSGSGSPYPGTTGYSSPTKQAGAAPGDGPGAPSQNGSTVGAFASGTASAVTGAAAGLASSVTSAWNRRGQNNQQRAQVRPPRKSSKRQAMLTLARVEPWSVMKFSFVASVVAFVILFVAVAVLYMMLAALGVFDSLQHTVSSITSGQGTSGTNISHWTSPSLILGYTAMLGALNIVLITAMATVGSVVYNIIAKTVGGIEVTLRETD